MTGATGRMGRTVIETAAGREDAAVVLAVNRGGGGEVAGVTVEPAADLADRLAAADADALVDFTGPESAVRYVDAAAEAGVPAVVGTTGFDDDQRAALRAASDRTPVLVAANFARGVQVLLSAVSELVERLPGYDVEVVERYHRRKAEAPSGTVERLLDRIADAGGPDRPVYGRQGDQERDDDEVGVHSIRAGDVVGENGVVFAGNHEVLEITQRAEDRGVFAAGAVDAAAWLAGRDPGWYEFDDVLAGD